MTGSAKAPSAAPGSLFSVDDCLIDCNKAKATDVEVKEQRKGVKRSTAAHIHIKRKQSLLQKLDIATLESYSDLWGAIQRLPSALVIPMNEGLYLTPRFYQGLKQSGASYLYHFLKENHIEIPILTMTLLEACAFYSEFTTYSMLETYLIRVQNPGWLQSDDSYSKLIGESRVRKSILKFQDMPPALQKELKDLERKGLLSITDNGILPSRSFYEALLSDAIKHENPQQTNLASLPVLTLEEEKQTREQEEEPRQAKFQCRTCGEVTTAKYEWRPDGECQAPCPKCGRMYLLGKGDIFY